MSRTRLRLEKWRGHRKLVGFLVAFVCLVGGQTILSPAARAYDGPTHQELTFLAAKRLHRCLGESVEQPFSPLQLRTIAASARAVAEGSFFGRLFRWHYYDPLVREDNAVAWLVETRFTDDFVAAGRSLRRAVPQAESGAPTERALEAFGRIVAYLQFASAPARALPVYVPRFWRWQFSDRFEEYPLQNAELELLLGQGCDDLDSTMDGLPTFDAMLATTAADTHQAVFGQVGQFPTTWESFWMPPDAAGSFGSYGIAGNSFGRYVEFPCGQGDMHRCVLITDDPAYRAFAIDRQLAAIRVTARALLRLWLDLHQGSVSGVWKEE